MPYEHPNRAAGGIPVVFLEFLGPLHGTHTADAADSKHHPVQMAKILSLYNKLHNSLAVFIFANVDAADIGIVVGDNRRELFQHAGAVVAEDRDLYGIALGATCCVVANSGPLDGDAPVAFV